jgi:HEAT repeat protein
MRRALQNPCTARRSAWLWLALAMLVANSASARDDLVLENLLRDCRDYRVRVRAAEALGRTHSTAASGALSAALVDKHPAVRVAAATALAQLGAADALPALRASLRDPTPAVAKAARTSIAQIELDLKRRGLAPTPARTIRYGVYVGELRDRSAARAKGMLPVLANSLDEQLRTVEGAQVIDAHSNPNGVPVYRVDGSIMDTDRALLEDKVTAHASVALLLTDDSNQTLRIVFKGAATTIEDLDRHGRDQPERVAQLAMARAVRAALRNASTAMNQTLAARGSSRPREPNR